MPSCFAVLVGSLVLNDRIGQAPGKKPETDSSRCFMVSNDVTAFPVRLNRWSAFSSARRLRHQRARVASHAPIRCFIPVVVQRSTKQAEGEPAGRGWFPPATSCWPRNRFQARCRRPQFPRSLDHSRACLLTSITLPGFVTLEHVNRAGGAESQLAAALASGRKSRFNTPRPATWAMTRKRGEQSSDRFESSFQDRLQAGASSKLLAVATFHQLRREWVKPRGASARNPYRSPTR